MSIFNFKFPNLSAFCFLLLIGAILGLVPLFVGGRREKHLRYCGFGVTLLVSGLFGGTLGPIISFLSATIFTVAILRRKKLSGDSPQSIAEGGCPSRMTNHIKTFIHANTGYFVLFCGWSGLIISQVISVLLVKALILSFPNVRLFALPFNLIFSVLMAIPIIAGTWMSGTRFKSRIICAVFIIASAILQTWIYFTILAIGMIFVAGHGPQ
ncbi:MAG TPA: hypothetical protein DCZ94_08185 [Lentisphaeria bacterium]|nr:MAG: hypothetical protein A2X48_19665 [Lentisphaerae bacterium GWF2_49_21]HBC86916.1 hypothetical protein [Lentisphaeria bacterium]